MSLTYYQFYSECIKNTLEINNPNGPKYLFKHSCNHKQVWHIEIIRFYPETHFFTGKIVTRFSTREVQWSLHLAWANACRFCRKRPELIKNL